MIKARFLCALALVISAGLFAQERRLDELPLLRERAIEIHITTTIEEKNQEVWNAFSSKVTFPGQPVGIRLVGDNLIIAVQFTPYLRQSKYALVAQSQIWINIPERGMSYKTDTHSIPIDLGEPILYFPLGSETTSDNPHIELLLTMYRYGEAPVTGEESDNRSSPTQDETRQQPGVLPRREGRGETGSQGEGSRPGGRNR
ncbi:MAG: hypothetical protein FWG29_07930 [Treponema sp.]|nr:hypothetical protein [Treponema sp.]